MITLGPFLVYEGREKWWYKFTLNDQLIQIAKSSYTSNVDLLYWQEHEFPSDEQYFLYGYDPMERFNVAFVFENNTICRVPLHQLPDQVDPENRFVISQVEGLRIINNKPVWCLENNTIAREKYPAIDLELFPKLQKNSANSRRITRAGNIIREYLDSLSSQSSSALESKESEANVVDAIQAWEMLQPVNCHVVEQISEIPESIDERNMYLWLERDHWLYKIKFLGHILSGKAKHSIVHNVLKKWDEDFDISSASRVISIETHPSLMKMLSECYLKLNILEQNELIATIQQLWPLNEQFSRQGQLDYCKALLNLNIEEEKGEHAAIRFDEINEFRSYISSIINFFAQSSFRKHPYRNYETNKKNISRFVSHLFVAVTRILGQRELLPLDLIISDQAHDFTITTYTGLSASESRLFNLIFAFNDPDFADLSDEQLLTYRLDLEGIQDPINNPRDNVSHIIDDALQIIVAQEDINQIDASNTLDNMCAILIGKINNELINRIYQLNEQEEPTQRLLQVIRSRDDLGRTLRILTPEIQRFVIRNLGSQYHEFFRNVWELGGIIRQLAIDESKELIFTLALVNHLEFLIDDFDKLFIILGELYTEVHPFLYSLLLPGDNLLRIIENSSNLVRALNFLSQEEKCELLEFFQPYLKHLIINNDDFNKILVLLDETSQVRLLPIFEKELSHIIRAPFNLDSFLNCLAPESRIRVLYMIEKDLPDLIDDKNHLLRITKVLDSVEINILFSLLKMQVTKFLPTVNDLLSIVLSDELSVEQSAAVLFGIEQDLDVFKVYQDELPGSIAVLANSLATEHHQGAMDYSYFTYDLLFERWSACMKLFLHENAPIGYQDFVIKNPNCFVQSFFKICQIKFTPAFCIREQRSEEYDIESTRPLFFSQPNNVTEKRQRLSLDGEVVDWLFDIIYGKRLFTLIDRDWYYEEIEKSVILSRFYHTDEAQMLFDLSGMLNAPNFADYQIQFEEETAKAEPLLPCSPINMSLFNVATLEEKDEEGNRNEYENDNEIFWSNIM